MSEIISRDITLGPCQVYCLQTENTHGQPVIFLHGARFQASTWRELETLDRVAQAGYRVYAIDFPGFGRSPMCAWSHEDVLKALIDQEAVSRPVLVGPSMSGKICLDFVLERPDLVGGLVLIGAVGVHEKREQLHTIEVPCLVFWGGKDRVAPLESGKLLAEKIKGAELKVFEGASHPCYLDEPYLWHTELLAFLKRNFSQGTGA
jgi:abhydrolase domain-containing protein 14